MNKLEINTDEQILVHITNYFKEIKFYSSYLLTRCKFAASHCKIEDEEITFHNNDMSSLAFSYHSTIYRLI